MAYRYWHRQILWHKEVNFVKMFLHLVLIVQCLCVRQLTGLGCGMFHCICPFFCVWPFCHLFIINYYQVYSLFEKYSNYLSVPPGPHHILHIHYPYVIHNYLHKTLRVAGTDILSGSYINVSHINPAKRTNLPVEVQCPCTLYVHCVCMFGHIMLLWINA